VRLRCDRDIDFGPLVEPPEELGAFEQPPSIDRPASGRRVNGLGPNQAVGLLPEADLVRIAEQPAIADHAVTLDRLTGEQRRLSRHGDGRDDVGHRDGPSACGEGGQARSVWKESGCQPDGINQHQGLRHTVCLTCPTRDTMESKRGRP
jgi:hypothetical protein